MDTSPPPARDPGRTIGLSNWRVRSKLIAVLVIPAVAFLVLASFGIGSLVGNAQAFEEGRSLAELGRQVTALVHELQQERDLSVAFTASADKGVGNALREQQPRVNQAAAAYQEAEAPLYDDLGDSMRSKFDAVRAGLDDVAALRESHGPPPSPGAPSWPSTRGSSTGSSTSTPTSPRRAGTRTSRSRCAPSTTCRGPRRSPPRCAASSTPWRSGRTSSSAASRSFSGLLAQQQAAFEQFQADANDEQRSLFADLVKGQAVLQVNRIQQDTIRRQSGEDIDAGQWLNASTTNMELLRSVESRLLEGVIGQSGDLSSSAQRDALRNALLIAVILGVALLALLLVARSMARPLQQLRAGAIEIAQHRLPDAVQRLRTTERGDLDVRVEPIGINSKDEIGQVAQAVDDIQQVAVQLATEQAGLRRSIGDMFTNLARRSQTLIDRQLELIDDLERNETDPETLEHLFRLDHLATRMRRNAEDLIVLSGADPGRHWVQPMTVVDVVRAAAAEVEEYQRVELLPLADLEVAGHVAVDVIHLLAELIENATAFSPPNTKVQIAGQAVPHGYVIEVEDRGLGMSDEELIQANERLANPPEIDFALSRVLGLYVVGRLSQRHGIKVQLRHSWYGGVTALTLLPNSLLVWPKVPQMVAAEPAAAAWTSLAAANSHRPSGWPRAAESRRRPARRPHSDLRGRPLRLVRGRAVGAGPATAPPAPPTRSRKRRRRAPGVPASRRTAAATNPTADPSAGGAGLPNGPVSATPASGAGTAAVPARASPGRRRPGPAVSGRTRPPQGGAAGPASSRAARPRPGGNPSAAHAAGSDSHRGGPRPSGKADPGGPATAGPEGQHGPRNGHQPAGSRRAGARPGGKPDIRPIPGRGPQHAVQLPYWDRTGADRCWRLGP